MKKLLLAILMICVLAVSATASLSGGWTYRKPINFTTSSHTLEPMVVNLSALCGGNCKADFTDVRVYDEDTESLIDYEFLNESFEHTQGTAQTPTYIQFIVPDASHAASIYYDNPTAPDVSTKIFNYTFVFNGDLQGMDGAGESLATDEYIDDGLGVQSKKVLGACAVVNKASDKYTSLLTRDDSGESNGIDYLHLMGDKDFRIGSGFTGDLFSYYFWKDDLEFSLDIDIWSPRWMHEKVITEFGSYTEAYFDDVLKWNETTAAKTATHYDNLTCVSTGMYEGFGFWVDNIRSSPYDFNQYVSPNKALLGAEESAPACEPDWVCSGFGDCQPDDFIYCNAATDLNTCGEEYTGNYSEFEPTPCDYCTPDWNCTSFGECILDSKECLAVGDLNTCGEEFTGSLGDYDESCTTPPVTGYVPQYQTGDFSKMVVDFFGGAGWEIVQLATLIVSFGVALFAIHAVNKAIRRKRG